MEWIITESNKLDEYGEQIVKMYEESYKKIGIINFGGWEGMKNYLNCSCYLLINTEIKNELSGIILYWLSEYGNKISLVISLTPQIAKTYVIPKLVELLKTPGFYIELSDALEYLVRKEGLENIKDIDTIQKLIPSLKDTDIFTVDDVRTKEYPLNKEKQIPAPAGSYLREIKDIGIHRKALYGLPCLSKKFDGDGCDRKCIPTGGNKKKSKVYGSYKNGEDIYKDKKGFYIIQWNVKEQREVKKHLKSLAKTVKRGEKSLKNWTRRSRK